MHSPRIASQRLAHLSKKVPMTKKPNALPAKPLMPASPITQSKYAGGPTDTITISHAAKAAAQSPSAERLSACSCPRLDLNPRPVPHSLLEIKQTSATLSGIQKTLFGQSGQSDVNQVRSSVDAEFLDVDVSAVDSPKLLDLLRKLMTLPPGSEVTIQGNMGDQPFEVKVEIKEDKTEVEIDGVTFPSQQAVESLLTDLRTLGVAEATVEGTANGQEIKAQFEIQEEEGELILEGFAFVTQNAAGAWLASLQKLGFQEIVLKDGTGALTMELKEQRSANSPA